MNLFQITIVFLKPSKGKSKPKPVEKEKKQGNSLLVDLMDSKL